VISGKLVDRILGLIEGAIGRVKAVEAFRELDRERLAEIENRLAAIDGGQDAGQSIDRARTAVLMRGGEHAAVILRGDHLDTRGGARGR
jgi:hypothetical protein